MLTPSLVMSHLHMPMVRLHEQTIIPFIIMEQLHMPPASILQRFCIMLQAILSSQEHMIFIPPLHFSILTVQASARRCPPILAGTRPAGSLELRREDLALSFTFQAALPATRHGLKRLVIGFL